MTMEVAFSKPVNEFDSIANLFAAVRCLGEYKLMMRQATGYCTYHPSVSPRKLEEHLRTYNERIDALNAEISRRERERNYAHSH